MTEPELPGLPSLESPAIAVAAPQESPAPPPPSVPHAVRAPLPETFAVPAAEPVVEPLPAEPPVPEMPAEEAEMPAPEAEEPEVAASETSPAEVEPIHTYEPPSFAPEVSPVEEVPAEAVPPAAAEAFDEEVAVRPETAVLAAAAQSAAAIGMPATDADAAPGEAAGSAGIDDLRARIEQTKAAVREALERPFSADEPETWQPEGSGAAFETDVDVAGDEGPVSARPEESAAVVEKTMGSYDVDVRSAFAEGSDEGVWVVPEVVAAEPAETIPSPAMEQAAAPGAVEVASAPVFEVEAAPVGADEVGLPSAVAEAEPLTGAGTAEASVWEPVADEEPAPAVAAASDAAAQVPPTSELDQAVADAFAMPDETSPAPEAAAVDQAEMRRRIEETRSRLKAKAFDAMTSGEAALLAHEPMEQAPSAEVEEPLDDEVQAVIDRSLSQDDY